jgi:hypothetical protein
METTTLAQIIGPIVAAAALGFFFNSKIIKAIMKDFEKSEGLTYLTGIIIMILGLVIVLNHNIWEFSAAGLITLIGWGSLIKGAIFLIIPNFLFKISKSVLSCGMTMKVAMTIWLVAGVYLSYIGYFA